MLAETYIDDPSERWVGSAQRYGPAVLCGLAGFLSAFTVAVGGMMPVGEILLLALVPWIVVRAFFRRGWPTRLQQLGWYRLLLIGVAFMAVGYIGSDLYRGTAFSNLARGWARVLFLGLDLIAIGYLIDTSWRRLRIFIFALYIGGVVNAIISGPLYDEWWKFGFGYATTAVVLFAVCGRAVSTQVVVAVALGILNLALGARSLGATCLLVAGLFGVTTARGIWRPIALLGSLSAIVALLFAANATIIENQEHSGSNIERQSMIETAAELFVGSPLVGQGSWFTAGDMIERLEATRAELDPTFRGYKQEEADKLSIHSQLLVALAEGGILGGFFFLILGALVLKTLRSVVRHPVPSRAFILFVLLGGAWDLLMSPFSGVARVQIALLACTCLLVILQMQGELTEDYRE